MTECGQSLSPWLQLHILNTHHMHHKYITYSKLISVSLIAVSLLFFHLVGVSIWSLVLI